VLNRPKFKLPAWVVQELLDYIRAQARWAAPGSELGVEPRDRADTKFLQAALSGQADLIVTEDKDLLDIGEFQGVRIVPPWEFLPLLCPSPPCRPSRTADDDRGPAPTPNPLRRGRHRPGANGPTADGGVPPPPARRCQTHPVFVSAEVEEHRLTRRWPA